MPEFDECKKCGDFLDTHICNECANEHLQAEVKRLREIEKVCYEYLAGVSGEGNLRKDLKELLKGGGNG